MKTSHFLATTLATWLLACASHANLLINGGFEEPANPPGPGSLIVISPGAEVAAGFTGWSVLSQDVDVVDGTVPLFGIDWGAQAAIEGAQILDLNGNAAGGIFQQFATSAGMAYLLTFYFTNNPLGSAGDNESASVVVSDVGTTNATLLSQSIMHTSATLTAPDWTLFSMGFTAAGPTTRLTLVSTSFVGGNSGGIVLDAVDVVPEPGSALLLAGAAGLLLARRGRR